MRTVKFLAFLAVGVMGLVLPAQAANVALFSNTTYVDYDPGNSNAEASNLEATLTALGHTVMTFTGITATDINNAVAGKDILVIPEIEEDDLNPDLDAAARTAIANFVSAGGTLIVFAPRAGDIRDVLNDSFGFSLLSSSGSDSVSFLNEASASGSTFAGGPYALPDLSATGVVLASSLPGNGRIVYRDSNSDSVVTLIPVGTGKIIIIGWDWFNAKPVGVEDGGWLNVLARAAGAVLPNVSVAPALSSELLWGLALLLATAGGLVARRKTRTVV